VEFLSEISVDFLKLKDPKWFHKPTIFWVHHGGVQMQLGLYLPRTGVQAENRDLQGENRWARLPEKVKVYSNRKSTSLLLMSFCLFFGFQIICHRSFALHRSPSGSMKNIDKTTTEFVI